MSGLASLEDFCARVESLSKMNAEVAKKALAPVTSVARETASASKTPTGEAWRPKKGGGDALVQAGEAIQSSVDGTKIVLKIGAPYVFHQHGAGGSSDTKEATRSRARTKAKQAKSGTSSKFHAPQRKIIPSPGDALPSKMADAIKSAAEDVFGKVVG